MAKYVYLPAVAVFLAHAFVVLSKKATLEPNGSTLAFSWSTNKSLGLTDKMRSYGHGFRLTPEEEDALDKVRSKNSYSIEMILLALNLTNAIFLASPSGRGPRSSSLPRP